MCMLEPSHLASKISPLPSPVCQSKKNELAITYCEETFENENSEQRPLQFKSSDH